MLYKIINNDIIWIIMETRDRIEHAFRTGAALVAASSAVASFAISSAFGKQNSQSRLPSVAGQFDCLPENEVLPQQNATLETSIDSITSAIEKTPLAAYQYESIAPLAPIKSTAAFPDPFNTFKKGNNTSKLYQTETTSERSINELDVSVTSEPGKSLTDMELQDGQGIDGWVVDNLYGVPASIVKASGLRQIAVGQFNDSNYFTQPEYLNGDLLVPYNLGINDGLAAMILKSYCSSSSRHRILKELKSITQTGGSNYNSNYYFNWNLGTNAENKEANNFNKKLGSTFYDYDAVRNPEIEFIEIFSNAIDGDNWYTTQELQTPLGKKQQLVQAVFDRIVPQGQDWEIYGDIRAFWGECGYSFYQNVKRIDKIENAYNATKTNKQKDIFLNNESNNCVNHASETAAFSNY